MRRRALLLFTRSPEAEARTKGFDRRNAAPLFGALLESWVRLARETATELVVASPAPCRRRLEESGLAPGARFLTQAGPTFGERLGAATREAFALGFDIVAVAGGDAPAIEAGELRRAFAEAEAGAVVLGPSEDGGVYLIVTGSRGADLGRSLAPRDPRALRRLLSAVADRGGRVVLLPRRSEIDSPLDAARSRRRADPVWAAYRFLLGLALRARTADERSGTHGAAAPLRRQPPRGPPPAA
ncbi:MAG TPA: DUF2064 domain-containing protein [Thermoanaerobaculia bacterium]|nr:DUF2064 domain-containing protein [Thermoanaerobaculia bacterium]